MGLSFLRSGITCGRPGPAEPGRKPQGEGGADSAVPGSGGPGVGGGGAVQSPSEGTTPLSGPGRGAGGDSEKRT